MVAVVGILVVPFSSDLRKERAWHITCTMLFGAVCFAVLMGVTNHKVQYAFLCFGVAAIYSNPPLVLVWTSNIISWPAEKRAISQAWVNAMGNSASIYGSFLWPKNTGPRYFQGFGTTLAMLIACAATAQVMNYLTRRYPYPAPPAYQAPDEVEEQDSVQDRDDLVK
jgi:peptidoglycan/LPS O-acetylase OafA/YrhL